jgi:hypothetical protein
MVKEQRGGRKVEKENYIEKEKEREKQKGGKE